MEDVSMEMLGVNLGTTAVDHATFLLDLLFTPSPTNKAYQALSKELHYANASGAPGADICAGCGTQRTLRQKLLRVARSRPERFIFLDAVVGEKEKKEKKRKHTPWGADAGSEDSGSDDEAGGVGFKGGKVLAVKAALYGLDKPVCVFDFGSLYPSIMRERNLCVTTRLTLAAGRRGGMPLAEVPPCPWMEGVWVGSDGTRRTWGPPHPSGGVSLTAEEAAVATLSEDGHTLQLADGTALERCPSTVLATVSSAHMVGLLPGMLAELKDKRTECKNAGKVAAKEGNAPLAVYWDLQQNAIKVLMNGAYGGLGAAQGGVFRDAFELAAAVTACGRQLITGVARTVEATVWLHPPTDTAGIDGIGEPAPPGATRPVTVYGDTDSAFIAMEGLSLAAANTIGDAIAAWYADRLAPPHVLEFEKVMSPLLMMKAKMYAGIKYEGSMRPEDGKLMVRGIAVVRRDNFPAAVTAQKALLNAVMKCLPQSELLATAADLRRRVRSSLAHVHDALPPPGSASLSDFVQTGMLSKPMVGPGARGDACLRPPRPKHYRVGPLIRNFLNKKSHDVFLGEGLPSMNSISLKNSPSV